jgi:branched-chain amino acid transport system substrate-binding protein
MPRWPNRIRIAVPKPKSGPLGYYGADVFTGTMLAIRHINARGGVLCRMLWRNDYEDGERHSWSPRRSWPPRQSVAVANKIVKDGFKFVIGYPCSTAAMEASEVYEDKGVLMIGPSATIPQLTTRGHRLLFRTVGTDDTQASVACDWIAGQVNPGPKRKIEGIHDDWVSCAQILDPGAKVAVLHDNQLHGEGIASSVKQGLESRGIEVFSHEGVIAGDRDHSPTIERLVQSKADLI